MEFIIIILVLIIVDIVLRIIFSFNMKSLKDIGKDEYLDNETSKYPENIDICKYYLKKLDNQSVKIEENKNSNSTLYLVSSNKIFIADLKDSYTRIQTIAHECLHSVQNKKLLWFNFIFSNIFLLYFIIIFMLELFNVLPYKMMFLGILSIFGLVYYSVRMYLENDAMINAKFLARDYMQDVKISDEADIDKIFIKYTELNDIGIKGVNFKFIENVLFKVLLFSIVCLF